MFTGFTQKTIDFMWGLRLNNNKPWFEEHKSEFVRDFQTPMKTLGSEVFERISEKYSDRGFVHKVSRIYKDARRVKNGEFYRSNMWFSFEKPPLDASTEWTVTPGFWFDLGPDNWSCGMGYGQAKSETMTMMRAKIDSDPKKFEKFISPLYKQDEFVLDGPEYVRKKESEVKIGEKSAEWYNRKSFSLIHIQPNGSELFSAELADRLVAGYEFLMPFYDYFIELK